MTEVVNMKDHELQQGDVYIGRGGPWGNPFVVGKQYTREAAIAAYRKYLWDRIGEGSITLEQLAALDGKTLVCFCAPLPCHGDVLAAAARWAVAQLAEDEGQFYARGDHELPA